MKRTMLGRAEAAIYGRAYHQPVFVLQQQRPQARPTCRVTHIRALLCLHFDAMGCRSLVLFPRRLIFRCTLMSFSISAYSLRIIWPALV